MDLKEKLKLEYKLTFWKKITAKLRLFSRIAFSRSAIFMLLLLLQMLLFVSLIEFLYDYMTYFYAVSVIVSTCTIIYILNEKTSTSFKLVWVLPVVVFPVVGVLLFLYVNLETGTKLLHKRLDLIENQIACLHKCDTDVLNEIGDKSHGEKGLASYLYNIDGVNLCKNCEMKYYPIGEKKFEDMLYYLKNAREYIFMEYFIISKGKMWNEILEILKCKVKEGVDVRVMYDGMCSLANLPYGYYKDLRQMGISSVPFSQIKPIFSTYQNNRDHRKILVIDGKVAFTGGINLADEYINEIDRFGHWKDVAIMLKGDVVRDFTLMFLKMWHVAMKNKQIPEKDLEYVRGERTRIEELNQECMPPFSEGIRKGGYVIAYGDDPYSDDRVGKQVYIDILNRAQRYVHIMTPYLILDDDLISAFKYCAKRGVETVIIMPHVPDKEYAYLLARTYYRQLLEYGVKIYEYLPGFVHAKVFVSDDIRAVVGTINLDFRSLYLHFECASYIYDNPVVMDVEKDFQETIDSCWEITLQNCDKFPTVKKFIGEALRLIAPLM